MFFVGFKDRLSGVAQFEREMMLERQREGVARAKVRASTRGVNPFQPRRRPYIYPMMHFCILIGYIALFAAMWS
ncbi:hypothetical protein LOD58_10950, partial [Xylella fastidiosa subsp. multiplex]|nr:hypothetical protein [Xylella fastidiosa subsp. multiplex]